MPARRASPALLVAALLLPAAGAAAGELWKSEDGTRSVSLAAALKVSFLATRAPDDELLYPERSSATGLLRGRLMLSAECTALLDAELAYEQRGRLTTEDAGLAAGGGGLLRGEARAPFRIEQLDWEIAEDEDEGTYSWRHEIDRALLALHPPWGEVVAGRQAIGLGRGVLFGALDVFAPFSPAEVDREWRRGVDALRVEHRLSGTFSGEIISAWGESWEESALLGRLRGYVGSLDVEMVAGKRGEDGMYALALSSTLGQAEVHAELAVFDLDEDWVEEGLFGDDRLVGKAVAGASYTFAVGEGLTLLGEYHYSGFGVEDIEDALPFLADPGVAARFARGDSQIIGRHAVGLQASYPLDESWGLAALVQVSPEDGSGTFSPSVNWSPTDGVGAVLGGVLPWGQPPRDGHLESQYGASPASIFLQVSIYY
jgi:hypothetical protein